APESPHSRGRPRLARSVSHAGALSQALHSISSRSWTVERRTPSTGTHGRIDGTDEEETNMRFGWKGLIVAVAVVAAVAGTTVALTARRSSRPAGRRPEGGPSPTAAAPPGGA